MNWKFNRSQDFSLVVLKERFNLAIYEGQNEREKSIKPRLGNSQSPKLFSVLNAIKKLLQEKNIPLKEKFKTTKNQVSNKISYKKKKKVPFKKPERIKKNIYHSLFFKSQAFKWFLWLTNLFWYEI